MLAGHVLGAAETNPLIPRWGELIIGLIAFGILVLLLMRTAFPAIERALAQRRDAIQGGLERAEKAQAEAQRTLAEYRAQLAEARGDANRIREEARVQGQQILDELRTQAQEEAARVTARGEQQLEAERATVVAELRGEIGRLAVGLASKVVGESLQDDRRARDVVDRFLDNLEAGAARDGGPPVAAGSRPAGGRPDGGAPDGGAPAGPGRSA